MDTFVIFAGAAVLGATAVVLMRWAKPAGRTTAVRAYTRRVDLALDESVEPVVAARLAQRERVGVVLGAVVGLAALAWIALGSVVSAEDPYAVLVVALAFFLGHAVGYGAVAWNESRRPAPTGTTRIARATAPTQDDYVPPIERRGARVAAALSVLVALGLVVVDAAGVLDLGTLPWGLVVAAVVLPPVTVVLHEVFAARLLEQRQVATTTLELAWDDALRSRTLRDMVTVAIVTGCYGPIALLAVVGDGLEGGWPANPAVGVVTGAVFLLGGVMVVTALVAAAGNPHRHFRKRLWPDGVEQQAHDAVADGAEAGR